LSLIEQLIGYIINYCDTARTQHGLVSGTNPGIRLSQNKKKEARYNPVAKIRYKLIF